MQERRQPCPRNLPGSSWRRLSEIRLAWRRTQGRITQVRDLVLNQENHLRITTSALWRWAIAQLQDSVAVGILWMVGLWIIHVPWAPLWALLAALLQIIPHFGPILGLLGPVLAAAWRWTDWQHPLYVLILYAVIVVVDGFVLQPYIMRRVARVPIWASILAPLVLGFFIPFWGFLLAPPLLAVFYAYKTRRETRNL